MLDLEAWPKDSRVVVRKERPHPGAQLSLFDMIEGFRHTAFIFAPRSEHEKITTGIGRLELRQREHARVEDRIRQGKAAGLKNFPCKEVAENNVWLELVLAAADFVCWSKLICFHDDPRACPLRDRQLPLPHLAHGRAPHEERPGHFPATRPHVVLGQAARARIHSPAGGVRLSRPHSAPAHDRCHQAPCSPPP